MLNEKENEIIEAIANTILEIDNLEEQGLDQIDFHELHISVIRKALEAAYEAGKNSS